MTNAVPYLEFKKLILNTQLQLLNLGYEVEFDKHMNEYFTNKRLLVSFTDDIVRQKIVFRDTRCWLTIANDMTVFEFYSGNGKVKLEYDTQNLINTGELNKLLEQVIRSGVDEVFFAIIKTTLPNNV
jgi:hypothetical protein